MFRRYIEVLQDAMEDRAGDILEILSCKEKYRAVEAKINDILDRIKENLPSEFEKLLLNIDDYNNDMKVLIGEIMYRYGVADGIIFQRILRKVRGRGFFSFNNRFLYKFNEFISIIIPMNFNWFTGKRKLLSD